MVALCVKKGVYKFKDGKLQETISHYISTACSISLIFNEAKPSRMPLLG
jgi:hypothetical protein